MVQTFSGKVSRKARNCCISINGAEIPGKKFWTFGYTLQGFPEIPDKFILFYWSLTILKFKTEFFIEWKVTVTPSAD